MQRRKKPTERTRFNVTLVNDSLTIIPPSNFPSAIPIIFLGGNRKIERGVFTEVTKWRENTVQVTSAYPPTKVYFPLQHLQTQPLTDGNREEERSKEVGHLSKESLHCDNVILLSDKIYTAGNMYTFPSENITVGNKY